MTDKVLAVLLFGAPIGTLRSDRNARLTFEYIDRKRTSADAVPLSLSLPLARRQHQHEAVEAFLWGLLPDNERVLERWAKQFHVSALNPFALLAHVGEDCAGAIQIVPPDRVAVLAASGAPQVQWLTKRGVAARLRMLRGDDAAWRSAADEGQFSLAGAQPKTALFHRSGRWGIPKGRTPTPHILKPPTGALAGQIQNEHFCLSLARALGLPTAESTILRFEEEIAIVLERYDRVRLTREMADAMAARAAAEAAAAAADAATAMSAEGAAQSAANAATAAARASGFAALAKTQPVLRLHQEDMCQALGMRPQSKYQSDGGPSPEQIAELLYQYSDRPREDVETFADALLFNWVIGGSDAHAKNYSLLHGAGGHVRLAPFYDIASALPYPDLNTRRLKLAMKIGGHYRLHEIGADELRKLARGLKLDPEQTIERARALCAELPVRARAVHDACGHAGVTHPILDKLVHELGKRAKVCAAALA